MKINEYNCTPTPQRPQDSNKVYRDDKGREYVWRDGIGWTLNTNGQDRFNRMNPFYVPFEESADRDDLPSIEDDDNGIDAEGFVNDFEPNKTTGKLMRTDKIRKINENQLRAIVAESIKKVLGESEERADLIHGDEPSRRIPKQDPYHYNDGPSPLEEEFEDELYNLIDSYKDTFINYGWKLEEFRAMCCEIINKV